MSWLFGVNKGQPEGLPSGAEAGAPGQDGGVSGAAGGAGGGGGGAEEQGYRSASYSFDSTALERAAKAAKVRKTHH